MWAMPFTLLLSSLLEYALRAGRSACTPLPERSPLPFPELTFIGMFSRDHQPVLQPEGRFCRAPSTLKEEITYSPFT